MRSRLPALAACLLAVPAAPAAEPFPPEAVEFFEAKVRPVLAENCQSCHGAKKQQGGLRLDSRQAVLQGGDTGPAAVAGKPDESLLVKAVRYADDPHMPPKGKMADDKVAALAEWVRLGMPWPNAEVKPQTAEQKPDASKHWAFQPVRDRRPPAVADAERVRTPVDNFVLAGLAEKGLSLSPEADRRTLLRRVTFDLTGLPPTPAEVDAFLADAAADAYEKAVERLLASPAYGERWARHWLDLARYSDTKGYVFQEDRNYPYAYTYRDWVIDAFNADLPYDRFVTKQLAADRLPAGGDQRDLAAMGFLTVGRRFLNNAHDIIDDRIDVVTRGLMGLTVTCARCHDHKYDPIPIKDYYSLYGVFASSTEPKELPLLGPVKRTPELEKFETELAKLQADVAEFRKARHADILAGLRKPDAVAKYLQAARDAHGQPNERVDALVRERDLNKTVLAKWRAFLNEKKAEPAVAAWLLLARLPDGAFPGPAAGPVRDARAAAAAGLAGDEKLVRAATDVPLEQVDALFNRADRDKGKALERKVDALKARSPAAPPRAMALNDLPKPVEPHVFLRGNPNNRGPQVPRQFPEAVAGPQRKPFTDGSGRLELAGAVASPDNPLTARVFVNRVWAHHFGNGLVRTPSDLGVRSEPPTHPELLDWLAKRFVEGGWSVKKLHRLIVLSAAYRQGSDAPPAVMKADPDNRWLARQNRRRLDWESLRDGLLATSGVLDRAMHGPAVKTLEPPFAPRRSVYGFIDRQNLPGTLRAFDFASPDGHSPQRFVTTVPQQALFLMNSPFAQDQARKLAARPEVASAGGPAAKARQLYRLVLGREPNSEEVALAEEFVAGAAVSSPADGGPWRYGHGRYDEAAERVEFHPLPHFNGLAWQGGPALPDGRLGWVTLNATGGHPGDARHAAVRRWVAPSDGAVSVSGALHHPTAAGDGVRGRVVHGRLGVVGEWSAHNGKQPTKVDRVEVKAGDTLDFVVDCKGGVDSDSFLWAPQVKKAGGPEAWDAARDFRGPAPAGLTGWEQYAQVLMLSNEFAFVD